VTGKSDLESIVRLEGAARPSAGPLDLEVGTGEFVVLIGPEGCGTSDVLRMAAGLLPAASGNVRTTERQPGFVWRDPRLLPWRTVRQNVLLRAELQRLPETSSRERARYLLGLLGAVDFEGCMPATLPPGIACRAAIARALLHQPALVLFDDPFRTLDSLEREQLWLDLQRVWMTERFAAILATTDIAEAIQLGDRVVVLTEQPARRLRMLTIDLPRPRRMHRTTTAKMADFADAIRISLRAQGALP
jgi:NitT/TauT family transport system ATP-binding protein